MQQNTLKKPQPNPGEAWFLPLAPPLSRTEKKKKREVKTVHVLLWPRTTGTDTECVCGEFVCVCVALWSHRLIVGKALTYFRWEELCGLRWMDGALTAMIASGVTCF